MVKIVHCGPNSSTVAVGWQLAYLCLSVKYSFNSCCKHSGGSNFYFVSLYLPPRKCPIRRGGGERPQGRREVNDILVVA